MAEKKIKTVRRTVVVFTKNNIPVTERVMQWESAGRGSQRRVYRVERATPGAGNDEAAYIIDMQLTCKGANRNDFTRFVRTYLPESQSHFITE